MKKSITFIGAALVLVALGSRLPVSAEDQTADQADEPFFLVSAEPSDEGGGELTSERQSETPEEISAPNTDGAEEADNPPATEETVKAVEAAQDIGSEVEPPVEKIGPPKFDTPHSEVEAMGSQKQSSGDQGRAEVSEEVETPEGAEGDAQTVGEGRNGHLSIADLALVEEVSAYFNALETFQGSFDQQNQDGTVSTGSFYLRRPGRMRFEYEEPQLTILSDGLWVMLNDRELESVDRYPLRETPLHLILKKKVDLAKDATIVNVERQGDLIGITAREEEGVAQGDLTLVFAGPRLELRHWLVEDVQGNRTLVSLRDVMTGMTLDPKLFIPEEYEYGLDFED